MLVEAAFTLVEAAFTLVEAAFTAVEAPCLPVEAPCLPVEAMDHLEHSSRVTQRTDHRRPWKEILSDVVKERLGNNHPNPHRDILFFCEFHRLQLRIAIA